MKKLFILSILGSLLFYNKDAVAQAGKNTSAKDTEWLEKQLNIMVKNNEADQGKKQFEFDDCQCKFATNNSKGVGFKFDMSYSFHLNEVNSVSYARNDDNSYELVLKLNKDKASDGLDFSSFTTTLYNSDESQVKEVVKKFKSATQACKNK